ncbi:MAG: glycosyltransferase [Oscillospiraceae bacterium]|nr:glycosyltransferase [Oscillospiraceae bacterium]
MISVVMTTYNGEQYVGEQIQSIFRQTLLPDELIVVDDGSTDNTVNVISELVKCAPPSINVSVTVNCNNIGYIRNFYVAISKAKGDFIFLSDQDDIWEENKIETMIDVMTQEKCMLLCSNFHIIDKNGSIVTNRNKYNINSFVEKAKTNYKTISLHRLIYGNVAQGCTYCFNKEIQNKYIELNCNYIIHDKQLMFIAATMGNVGFLNRKLIRYRIHDMNSIGISTKKTVLNTGHKKIKKTPVMVRFLSDLNDVIHVPRNSYYKVLYYLRVPYIVFVLKRMLKR